MSNIDNEKSGREKSKEIKLTTGKEGQTRGKLKKR